jgi:hypothetical protein
MPLVLSVEQLNYLCIVSSIFSYNIFPIYFLYIHTNTPFHKSKDTFIHLMLSSGSFLADSQKCMFNCFPNAACTWWTSTKPETSDLLHKTNESLVSLTCSQKRLPCWELLKRILDFTNFHRLLCPQTAPFYLSLPNVSYCGSCILASACFLFYAFHHLFELKLSTAGIQWFSYSLIINIYGSFWSCCTGHIIPSKISMK